MAGKRPVLIAFRYGVAAFAVVAAGFLRYLLQPALQENAPFVTFFLAVLVAAYYSGPGPAAFAMIVSALAADYFFIPPLHTISFYVHHRHDTIWLLLFVLDCAVAIGLIWALKRARRAAEGAQQVRRAYAYNRSLIEASLDPMVTIAPDGRITDVNRATEMITGCSRRELLDTDFSEYFTQPEKARAGYQQVFREGQVQDYELEIRHRDGHLSPIIYNASVYNDEAGKIVGVFAAARDITARKKAEEQLQKLNQELEQRVRERTADLEAANLRLARASQLKSQFVSRMSHEFRTPMNAIIGFSDLLAEQPEEVLNDICRRFVGHIREGARYLLHLLNDILDLSRIEAGQMDLHPEEFPVGEALAETLQLLQPLVAARGLRIDTSVHTDLRVFADRTRFKQIFHNLLSNAIKFTPPGGRAWVESCERDGTLVLSVCDTGPGIAPEEQGAIFEEFYQARNRVSGTSQGTGLGLAITKSLVERQGGEIQVASTPGKGSRFTVTLPATRTASKAHVA